MIAMTPYARIIMDEFGVGSSEARRIEQAMREVPGYGTLDHLTRAEIVKLARRVSPRHVGKPSVATVGKKKTKVAVAPAREVFGNRGRAGLTFRLEIDLGSSSMRTSADVVQALREVAERVEDTCDSEIDNTEAPRNITSRAGHAVGFWAVEEEGEEPR